MLKEYKTISEVVGPLMVVDGVRDAKYDELVEIMTPQGVRIGRVLELDGERCVVQLFESSQGLQISRSRARVSNT